jgi:hypothetical protein
MGLCALSGPPGTDEAERVSFATTDRFERLLGHSGLGFGVNVLLYLERREAACVRAVGRVFRTAVERRRNWPVRSCVIMVHSYKHCYSLILAIGLYWSADADQWPLVHTCGISKGTAANHHEKFNFRVSILVHHVSTACALVVFAACTSAYVGFHAAPFG